MGTGISMSSVNKIKELAESGDYSLALDILDHQDLTKSLSPQFVRICGEVYYENKRYPEARAALVKAHSMAPVGNKIIFSLIQLYLSMGFYQLAEKYFEIYQYNQETRDAGTYRIEYLIARAKRKPIIELYSILLSANELETDEKWDFEMLLMHAAMNNMDKLAAEGEMFRATYKSSTRFGRIDALMNQEVDVKSLLYCFPEEEILDTDPEQQEIRDFEANVLQSDELRMHPKDPKIMIMVENNEPIPNSVKLKQMFIRSKEKKEERREKKRDKSEGEDTEKSGLFGRSRISRKDEEAIEDVLAKQTEKDVNKEELLNEIISESNDQTDTTFETMDNPEMVELTDESTPEDNAVYNNDVNDESDHSFDDTIDESDFPDDDEFETVVMVDVNHIDDRDITTSTFAESEDLSGEESETEEVTEIDPEVAEIEESFEVESEVIEPEEVTEIEPEVVEFEENIEVEPEIDEFEEDSEVETELDEFEEIFMDESEIDFKTVQIDEVSEEVEEAHEPEVEINGFDEAAEIDDMREFSEIEPTHSVAEEGEDAEKAEVAEGLNEFKEAMLVSDEDVQEVENHSFDDEFNDKDDFDIDFAIQSIDEYKMNISDDEIVMVEGESDLSDFEPEMDETEFVSEEEPELEETDFIAEEESELEETDFIAEEEPEPEETEFVAEEEPKPEEDIISEEEENIFDNQEDIFSRKNLDFPVFKTSLFPDYNRDEPPVIQPSSKPKVEIDEEKINENLKKEEDLLNETDKLLARLGIELGTNYSSRISTFYDEDDDELSIGLKKNSGNNTDNGFSLKKN